MSEVKRFDHVNHAHIDDCEHVESSEGAWVTASDYDALAAKLTMAEDAAAKGDAARQQCGGMEMEIEELRAELAELRARVVVSPDFDNDVIIETFRRNGFQIELGASYSVKGQIAQLLNALEELARLNGMTVSEELLRRLGQVISWQCFGDCRAFSDQRIPEPSEVIEELRALLNEDKEHE
ncbi:hypothetical protein ABZR68_12135 [Pseudomonas aeruginosa]